MQIEITKGFTQKTCGTCGVIHFIPDELEQEAKSTGQTWYCPNGHGRSYKESEADKYKRLYEQTERYRLNAVQENKHLKNDVESLDKALKAEKAKTAKKKARKVAK
jgi:cytochrome c553